MSKWRGVLVFEGRYLEAFHQFVRKTRADDVDLAECGNPKKNGKIGGKGATETLLHILQGSKKTLLTELRMGMSAAGFSSYHYALDQLKKFGHVVKNKDGSYSLTPKGRKA